MNEDQIVARAQREVAMRRTTVVTQRWNSTWRWLPMTLVLMVVVSFFAAPSPVSRKLFLAMSGVCSLRPTHSYFAGGLQFPLESRMMGIYAGFALTLVMLLLARRTHARKLGGWWVLAILLGMFGSMVFDGVNSTLMELGLPYLYVTTNPVRLATGLLSGIALAVVLIWLFGVTTMPPDQAHRRVVRSPWELLFPLILAGGFAVLVIQGAAWSYYPVAFTTVSGIVAALTGVALLVIMMLSGLDRQMVRVHDLVGPGAVALLVAFAVLATAAALRWSVNGIVEMATM